MSLLIPAISRFRSPAALLPRLACGLPCIITLASLLALLGAPGCIGNKPSNPAATQPVTNVPPEMAQPDYWLAQPANAEVTADSFDALWAASEAAAHSFMFPIDSRDYRRGLLKTEAVTSKQFFEFWRKDSATFKDTEENSLGPIRRTIYFQFTRNLDGTFTVTPKIVLERMFVVDPKYATAPDATPQPGDSRKYWYALRRDPALETKVAAVIQSKLRP